MKTCVILLIAIILISCSGFDNAINDSSRNSIEPIVTVQGTTETSPGRFSKLAEIKNPQVGLLWQEMDAAKINRYSTNIDSDVDLISPFNFSSNILENPPAWLNDSISIFVGHFCLYSDNNNNNSIDNIIHPQLRPYRDSLNNLKQIYISELTKLKGLSLEDVARTVSETFYFTNDSLVLFESNGVLDSSWNYINPNEETPYNELPLRRMQILRNSPKWEAFLSNRANINLEMRDTTHHETLNQKIISSYHRRIFPILGKEIEFEQQLKQTAKAFINYATLDSFINRERYRNRWNEYSYTPLEDNDWIAGRSIWNFVFYLFSQDEVNEVLTVTNYSQSMGRTIISNSELLKVGYNILECNANYYCTILTRDDSVTIYLGDESCYLEGCQRELEEGESRVMVQLSDSIITPLTGHYESDDSKISINFIQIENELWAYRETGEFFMLHASTKTIFFNSIFYTDVEFLIDSTTHKILYSEHGSKQQIATRTGEVLNLDSLIQEITNIKSRLAQTIPATVMEEYEGKYVLTENLSLMVINTSDSLEISIPGVGRFSLLAKDTDSFYSKYNSITIDFIRNQNNEITKLLYRSPEVVFSAPLDSYLPKTASSLNAELAYGRPEYSTNPGSKIVSSEILEESYACLTDLLAIQNGDGIIRALSNTNPELPLLGGEGDYIIFEISEAFEKVNLVFEGCPNRVTDSTSLRMEITGGTSLDNITEFIEDEANFTFTKDGSIKSVNPIMTNYQSPYYIKVQFHNLYQNQEPIVLNYYTIRNET